MKRKKLNEREAAMICDALFRRHAHFLKEGERFEVSGTQSKTEVACEMILRNQDDSLFYPVEARVDPRVIDHTPEEAETLLLDFLDYYFGRYLREGRDVYVPIDWHPIEFDEVTIEARGQVINRKLEQLADELLAQQDGPYEA